MGQHQLELTSIKFGMFSCPGQALRALPSKNNMLHSFFGQKPAIFCYFFTTTGEMAWAHPGRGKLGAPPACSCHPTRFSKVIGLRMAFECPLNGQKVRKTVVFQLFFGLFFAKCQGNILFFIGNALRTYPRQENVLKIMIEPRNTCCLTKKCSLHMQIYKITICGTLAKLRV